MNSTQKFTIIAALLIVGRAAHAETGHAEWITDGVHTETTVSVIAPSGNNHRMDCSGAACSIDSAHGYAALVLADGSRHKYTVLNHDRLGLSAAASSAQAANVLAAAQQMVRDRATFFAARQQDPKARFVATPVVPVWPTFDYKPAGPDTICAGNGDCYDIR